MGDLVHEAQEIGYDNGYDDGLAGTVNLELHLEAVREWRMLRGLAPDPDFIDAYKSAYLAGAADGRSA